MAGQPTTTSARRWFALATAAFCFVWSASPAHADRTRDVAEQAISGDEYQFVCDNDGSGLSIVDVLQATGDHQTFLSLFSQYNPEGFAILSDPELRPVSAKADEKARTFDVTPDQTRPHHHTEEPHG